MKVAVYSGNIPSTTFIENLITGLSESGIEILLFGKRKGNTEYNKNVKIYPVPSGRAALFADVIIKSSRLILADPGLYFKTIKELRKKRKSAGGFLKNLGMILPMLIHKYDIFHIQWAKTISQNPEIFELLKSKMILSLRGAHINYSPLTDHKLADSYRKYFPSIDGFHAVSEAIGKEAIKYGADSNKIKVIYTSIKNNLPFKKTYKELRVKPPEIISIGRFHWKKGYHYAMDAMKILKDKNILFHYTLVAQGKIPEEILFLITRYGLEENVTIIPGMKYDELIKKLTESDLLILPSVEEGIANVVLESMAVGVPVVTTDCGGMEEAVTDNVNGYIVRVRDVEMLAEKIIQSLSQTGKNKDELISNAKKTTEEKFSSDRQIREFKDLYSTVLHKII